MRTCLLLLTLVLMTSSAFADERECERRMTYDVLGIVQKALFRGVLTPEQASAFASGETPSNPLRHAVPTPENANYIRAFEGIAGMSVEHWLAERPKIQALVSKAEERAEVEAKASDATAGVMGLVTSLGPLYGGLIAADNGEIYYSVVEGRRLTVRRLLVEEPVWRDTRDIDEKSFARIRMNPSTGAPEMLYYRFEREPARWEVWARDKKHFEVLQVDLLSGRESSSRAFVTGPDAVDAVARWAEERRAGAWTFQYNGSTSHPSGVTAYDPANLRSTQFSIAFRQEPGTVVADVSLLPRALGGKTFAAISRLSPQGNVAVEVFDAADVSKPVFSVRLPLIRTTDVFLFEREGDLYLIADQVGGLTRMYRPLKSENPMQEADLNAYRTFNFRFMMGRKQNAYIVSLSKDGKTTYVLSPFARTR